MFFTVAFLVAEETGVVQLGTIHWTMTQSYSVIDTALLILLWGIGNAFCLWPGFSPCWFLYALLFVPYDELRVVWFFLQIRGATSFWDNGPVIAWSNPVSGQGWRTQSGHLLRGGMIPEPRTRFMKVSAKGWLSEGSGHNEPGEGGRRVIENIFTIFESRRSKPERPSSLVEVSLVSVRFLSLIWVQLRPHGRRVLGEDEGSKDVLTLIRAISTIAKLCWNGGFV
ncbi:MAG: hypothetical protein HQM00_00150 [Magnetococcales bacterium]|nr:hypothetical protein [Magnetococcales bacterium]